MQFCGVKTVFILFFNIHGNINILRPPPPPPKMFVPLHIAYPISIFSLVYFNNKRYVLLSSSDTKSNLLYMK